MCLANWRSHYYTGIRDSFHRTRTHHPRIEPENSLTITNVRNVINLGFILKYSACMHVYENLVPNGGNDRKGGGGGGGGGGAGGVSVGAPQSMLMVPENQK